MHRAFLLGLVAGLALIAGAVAAIGAGGGDDRESPPTTAAATSTATTAAATATATTAAAATRPAWPRRTTRDYAMFSRAGNRAMRRVVGRAASMLRHGASREAAMRAVRLRYPLVEDVYREAGDTAVREAVGDELDRWLAAAGYELIEAYDEFAFG